MAASSILYNMSAFNIFWNETQYQYKHNVPANWYKYFANISNDYYYYDSREYLNDDRRANFTFYKHITDLMVYFGARTQMDKECYAVVNGTNYALDAFNQNYNMDWWYCQKYRAAYLVQQSFEV